MRLARAHSDRYQELGAELGGLGGLFASIVACFLCPAPSQA